MAKIVEGVLTSAAGGAASDDDWQLVFHLLPWQLDGGDVRVDKEMRVEIPMTERQVDFWANKLPAQSIVRVAVTKLDDKPAYALGGKAAWSLIVGVLPVKRITGTAALVAAHENRMRPVVVKNKLLGTLTLVREYNWYEGNTKLGSKRVDVTIDRADVTDDAARDHRDITRAQQIVERVAASLGAIDDAIVRKMLPLYNKSWREGPEITGKDLLARIRPSSIAVERKSVSVWYRCGDLFGDHAIEVVMKPNGAISRVQIA